MIAQASARPDWAVGFLDECWFSRLAQPGLHTWSGSEGPLRLWNKERANTDQEAKALACYGVLVQRQSVLPRMLLRFVDGRPVSDVTCSFLAWLAGHEALATCRALVLFWDNASWHVSKEVRAWVRQYNRTARQSSKLRLVVCPLPTKSPWLNAIEPKWVHGKRAVCEPARVLPPRELQERLCCYYRCECLEPLKQ